MKLRTTLVAWSALVGALGCGSSGSSGSTSPRVDLAGMYAVTNRTRNTASCDVEGTDSVSFTHFQVVKSGGYTAVECDSADPSSCPEPIEAATSGRLVGAWDTPETDGWSLEQGLSLTISGCHLSYVIDRGTLADVELRAERRTYGEDADLTGSQCSTAEANARKTSMPCEEFVVVVGTRL